MTSKPTMLLKKILGAFLILLILDKLAGLFSFGTWVFGNRIEL